jgi:outer membrane receptor protein involved in Fe transport
MANYLDENLNVNFIANIVGRRDDFRAASPFGDTTKPSYVRLDLASYYSLPWQMTGVKTLTLFGKVENLLNKKYDEADGFRARPTNFLLGVRGSFGM